jgi:transposase-like protein
MIHPFRLYWIMPAPLPNVYRPSEILLMLQRRKRSDERTVGQNIKRWTAKRKSALVIEIIQGKTTLAEASRSYDLGPSEIENLVDDARKGMENALRTKPLDVREQYEKQVRDLQEAYGEAMLELRT